MEDSNLRRRGSPDLHEPTKLDAAANRWLKGGAAVVDPRLRVLRVNSALAAWLGCTSENIETETLPALVGRKQIHWEKPLGEFLQRADTFDSFDLMPPHDGSVERLRVECCAEGGVRFVRMESVLPVPRELEELFPEESWGRVAVQDAFQRSLRTEAQLANLLHRWPGIIFSQRPDFSFAFVSPKIEEITGVSVAEWRRNSSYFWRVVHELDAEPLAARMRKSTDSGEEITSTYRVRHIKTGRVTYLWEHRQPIRVGNGLLIGYEGIWLDITRQTLAERRLLGMSWKENLGTLTMGLAHDFCNVLTSIVALSETVAAELPKDAPLKSGLGLIRASAMQATQLSHRIRQLHDGRPGERSYLDLNEVVSNTASLLQKVLSRRVRLNTQLAADSLPVYVDSVALQQVIVNLALNAADAMPQGGEVTFITSRHEQAPATPNLLGALPRGPLACLSVRDTGSGIPARYLASIFEPFFTTKPMGKGSGLGLYNARLFAEKNGAAISVETAEGSGTTFHLWFNQSDFTEASRPEAAPQRERHTFLVVGFPGPSLEQTADLLVENGHYAVTASSREDALELLHEPHFHFTAMLVLCTDPKMPELSLCRRIQRESFPLKKVISLIGCNPDEIEGDLLESADAVLTDDASVETTLAKLNRLLNPTK